MSWRTGSTIFLKIWPILQSNIEGKDELVDFTARLLKTFVEDDMDPWEVEDVHPDVRAAMRRAGIEIAEPEKYPDEET